MSEWMLLLMFIPTFFVISVSPGLCMMLALSFGASLGVRRSLWVIAGEVVGVSLIALTALLGYTQVLVEQPLLMQLFKYLGALYLLWMGIDGWRNASTSLAAVQADSCSGELMLRGFSVAISNPKSWLFMMTLLPPFISPSLPLGIQTLLFVSLVALIECLNLLIYAYGGHRVNQLLLAKGRGAWLGRVSSLMMVSIALFWLLS
ncbi:LysE family translocator [Shewanella zhangzhouensis]|uniref:LysE family translocator n=1 Tax=Shewanella zhangzhouensis TaxID=2864213 RepID=UPI001C658684|nr:LysE family translocator [Shewanella zhangzhouensis]QYK05287.1 LysE family translocator [Shewanella zhangzhouensis]